MRRIAIQDVTTIERDIVEPFRIKTGTLFVGLENIESGGRLVNVRAVESGELASSKFAFTPRHVLYGKLRPNLAKIARPEFDGICSTDILPVLPGPQIDRAYLAWLLLAPEMVTLAASRATGANLPRLSPSALGEMTLPLPLLSAQLDLSEVKRIRATPSEMARTHLVRDDLLIVEGHGNPEEIGRVAIWNGSIAGCVHQNHLIRVRVSARNAIARYVCDYLNSRKGTRALDSCRQDNLWLEHHQRC